MRAGSENDMEGGKADQRVNGHAYLQEVVQSHVCMSAHKPGDAHVARLQNRP